MNFRTTLGVLLLVVVLAGSIWWFELRETTVSNGREDFLLPFAADSIESVQLEHTGVRFLLSRRGNNWVMISPIEAPCDAPLVDRLLTVLSEAQVEQNVGKGEDARYGLDAPTSQMMITSMSGSSTLLQFGRINPLQTLVYVKKDESAEVLLTTSELLTLSLTTDFGWRDKTIVDVPLEAVQRIRLSTLIAGSLVVERAGATTWRVQGEVPWRVDPIRLQNLLLLLAQMRAVGVSAEGKIDLEKYGLDTRRLSAVLEDAQGNVLADIIVGFGKGDGSHYAIVPDKPEIFRAGGDLSETLTAFTADCRDRQVFPKFDSREVTRIEVNSASDAFAVARKSITRWGVEYSSHHDSTFVVDSAPVQSTLDDLLAMRVDEFPQQQPPLGNYDPAEMTITLHGKDGFLSGIQVGRKDPNGFLTFVRGLDEPTVFLVSPGSLIRLPFDLERLGYEPVEVLDTGER